MKKILFAVALLQCLSVGVVKAQDFITNGNTYEVVSTKETTNEISTPYTFKVKDVEYPIFLSKNGCAYIKRTSAKGNEYKQYLGAEISKDICAKMNIEYKGK